MFDSIINVFREISSISTLPSWLVVLIFFIGLTWGYLTLPSNVIFLVYLLFDKIFPFIRKRKDFKKRIF